MHERERERSKRRASSWIAAVSPRRGAETFPGRRVSAARGAFTVVMAIGCILLGMFLPAGVAGADSCLCFPMWTTEVEHEYEKDGDTPNKDYTINFTTTPAADSTSWVLVESSLPLSVATATDYDTVRSHIRINSYCLFHPWTGFTYGTWGAWSPYSDCLDDDLTSGYDSTDFHVKWLTSANGLLKNTETNQLAEWAYGPTAIFVAGEADGNQVDYTTITVELDDACYSANNAGHSGDATDSLVFGINVWEVALTGRTSGSGLSQYNNATVPASLGGGQLGELSPGGGINGFYNVTELIGDIPSGAPAPTTGYLIAMSYTTLLQTRDSEGNWEGPNIIATEERSVISNYSDYDSRSPNGTGTDRDKIFACNIFGNTPPTGDDPNLYRAHNNCHAWIELNDVQISETYDFTDNVNIEYCNGVWARE